VPLDKFFYQELFIPTIHILILPLPNQLFQSSDFWPSLTYLQQNDVPYKQILDLSLHTIKIDRQTVKPFPTEVVERGPA
jgi:hypothetical protein